MVQEHESGVLTEDGEHLSMKCFREFTTISEELQDRNDKYERIVKIGRDITIESKHLIYALHARLKDDRMHEPSKRVESEIEKILFKFHKIADLLKNEDPYVFQRAWYSGIEEFIEAVTFYKYMTTGKLFTLKDIQQSLVIKEDPPGNAVSQPQEPRRIKIKLEIPIVNYMLGVQDMTGELMRLCIGAICSGKKDIAVHACNFVKEMYMAMSGIVHQSKDYRKKLEVVKESLLKMEYAVYTSNIRGTEIPSHMIENVIHKSEAAFLI